MPVHDGSRSDQNERLGPAGAKFMPAPRIHRRAAREF
jgi:hypothetical protein